MILIKNRQRKFKIDTQKLHKNIQIILDALDYSDFDIGVMITTNATIRKYNLDFRKIDKSTDVLSFPVHTSLKAGARIKAQDEWDKNLGDIIISPEYIQKKAVEYGETFDYRFDMLIVHSICHLLGYDHIEDADYKKMQKKEKELLALIS